VDRRDRSHVGEGRHHLDRPIRFREVHRRWSRMKGSSEIEQGASRSHRVKLHQNIDRFRSFVYRRTFSSQIIGQPLGAAYLLVEFFLKVRSIKDFGVCCFVCAGWSRFSHLFPEVYIAISESFHRPSKEARSI
jgi:hypothetical protein